MRVAFHVEDFSGDVAGLCQVEGNIDNVLYIPDFPYSRDDCCFPVWRAARS